MSKLESRASFLVFVYDKPGESNEVGPSLYLRTLL
jgi:hypothetical protein